MNRKNSFVIFGAWLALTAAPLQTIHSANGPAPSQGSGVVSGSVSSAQTGNMLQGAVINIPSLNRQVVNSGRFRRDTQDYRYLPARTRQTYLPGQVITFGMSGQF